MQKLSFLCIMEIQIRIRSEIGADPKHCVISVPYPQDPLLFGSPDQESWLFVRTRIRILLFYLDCQKLMFF
jgi:hypothetical protein